MAEKLISIHVTTSARTNLVEVGKNGELRVKVRAVAEKGRANRAVIELLAEYLSVAKSHIEIVTGQTSRNKRIRLQTCSAPEVK